MRNYAEERYEPIWEFIKKKNRGKMESFFIGLNHLRENLEEMGQEIHEISEEEAKMLLGSIDTFYDDYGIYEALIDDFNRNSNNTYRVLDERSIYGLEKDQSERFENYEKFQKNMSSEERIKLYAKLVFWSNRLTKVLIPALEEERQRMGEDFPYFKNYKNTLEILKYMESYESAIENQQDPEALSEFIQLTGYGIRDTVTPQGIYQYFTIKMATGELYNVKNEWIVQLMSDVKRYNEKKENRVKISAGIEKDNKANGKLEDYCVVDMPGYNIPLRVHIPAEVRADIVAEYSGRPIYGQECSLNSLIMFPINEVEMRNLQQVDGNSTERIANSARCTYEMLLRKMDNPQYLVETDQTRKQARNGEDEKC